jgi:hypothetical protein
LINIYRTPVSGVLRRKDSDFAVCGENLASVSQFVAGIRHGLDLQSGGSRIALAQREQAYLLAFRDEAAKGDRGATSPLGGVAQ